MKITFIQTGGTIDKDYPRTKKGYAFEIGEPGAKRILERLNPSFEYEIISVLKKDSLDITDEDRVKLLETCQQLDSDKIIITHGTDTMVETAKVLGEIRNKTIIITGAMRPEMFSNSDAGINLGVAIGAIETVEAGVNIAMHGRVMYWKKCQRNLENGKYYSQ